MMKVCYYDDRAKEMRIWPEGFPLGSVTTIRSHIGNVMAFDEDGYAVGLITDDGAFSVFPKELWGRRHVSDYGKKIPIRRGKPEHLLPLGDLPELGSIDLALFHGGGSFLRTVKVRLIKSAFTVPGLYFEGKKSFEFDLDFLLVLKRRIREHEDLIVDLDGKKWGVPGPVFVRYQDLSSILFKFAKFVEDE